MDSKLEVALRGNSDVEILDDNAQWKNRFEIKSGSSNRVYVIAQRKSDNSWGCSCPGWKIHRHCKHLTSIEPLIRKALGK